MPATRKAKDQLNATRPHEDRPRKDDVFAEGYTWAEFEVHEVHNKDQCKVSFEKPDQMWHYLGKTSTEAKAQYTENPDLQRHNPRGNFLNTVPIPKPSKPPKPPKPCKPAKPPKPALVSQPGYNHASYVAKAMAYSYNLAANHAANHAANYAANYAAATTMPRPVTFDKPHVYTPRQTANNNKLTTPSTPAAFTTHPSVSNSSPPVGPAPVFYNYSHPSSAFAKQSPCHHQNTLSNGRSQLGQPLAAAPVHSVPCKPVLAPSTQPGKPLWQVHSSIYQKYPFFQVNHNR